MNKKDIYAVLNVIKAHKTEHFKCAKKEIPAIFNDITKKFGFFVAEVESRIVGCVGFIQDIEVVNIYWAVWFYVHPEFRRKGIGKLLWRTMEDNINELGGRKIYFDVGNEEDHKDAIIFYEKRGYKKEGKLTDFFKDGEHKIIYGKKLRR